MFDYFKSCLKGENNHTSFLFHKAILGALKQRAILANKNWFPGMQQENVAHCNRGGSWKLENWCYCFHWVLWVHAMPWWRHTFSVQTAEEARVCMLMSVTIHHQEHASSDLFFFFMLRKERTRENVFWSSLFMEEEIEKGNWLEDWNKPTNERRAKGQQRRYGQN